jgi:prevent-host-death family protein
VRELKQRLSEYLDRAERGEIIRVTDRGRPKALLGPLPGRLRLEEGIAKGWVTPGSGQPLGPVKRIRPVRKVSEVLGEDRGE